jgi:hypothetical protein
VLYYIIARHSPATERKENLVTFSDQNWLYFIALHAPATGRTKNAVLFCHQNVHYLFVHNFLAVGIQENACYSSFKTTVISPLVSTPILERPVLSTLIHVCFRTGRTPAPRCVPRNTSRRRVPADTRGSSSCQDSAAGSGCVTAQLQVSVSVTLRLTFSQPLLVSNPFWDSWSDFSLKWWPSQTLYSWGALSDVRVGLSFVESLSLCHIFMFVQEYLH